MTNCLPQKVKKKQWQSVVVCIPLHYSACAAQAVIETGKQQHHQQLFS